MLRSSNLYNEDAPAWYDLDFRDNKIIVVAHALIASKLAEALDGFWEIEHSPETLGIPNFVPPSEPEWGFGSVIRLNREASGLVEWHCPLPVIFDPETKPEIDWRDAFAVSASLRLLFICMDLIEDEINVAEKQLMAIAGMNTEKGEPYGGAISVAVSPRMCQWIAAQSDKSYHSKIAETMVSASLRMFNRVRSDIVGDTYVRFQHPKWVNFNCSGNSCGLDPTDYRESDPGYKLAPHNTDTPLQQLTLLAGLAKMYKIAREDGF